MNKLATSAQSLCHAYGRSAAVLGSVLLALSLTACTNVLPPQALTHSPQFEPVYPVQNARETMATGAIYVGRQSDSWFGKGRNFQVGDVITVLLNESTQAARTQNGTITRDVAARPPDSRDCNMGRQPPGAEAIGVSGGVTSPHCARCMST